VSQAPNLGQLTAIEVHSRAISEEIIRVLSRRQQLLDRELEELCRWFSSGECANEDFRAYFATDELPQGTCATPECRCSSYWSAGGAEEQPPRLYEAFMATDLRPAAATGSHRRRSEQQFDGHVWHLL
jgi:hypothetical protein